MDNLGGIALERFVIDVQIAGVENGTAFEYQLIDVHCLAGANLIRCVGVVKLIDQVEVSARLDGQDIHREGPRWTRTRICSGNLGVREHPAVDRKGRLG